MPPSAGPPGAPAGVPADLPGPRRPRIAVVHHQRLVGDVLAARLAWEQQLDVLPPATDADAGLHLRADVLVVSQRVLEGQLTGELPPEAPSLVVLADADSGRPAEEAVRVLRAGARAWLSPDSGPEALAVAVLEVLRGRLWLPAEHWPEVVADLLVGEDEDPRFAALSPREREVLEHLCAGRSTSRMAELMFLSPNTVRSHRHALLAKLGVHSALQAVALARSAGFTPCV